MRKRQTSCGVIVTDGERILLGHATRSPRWDIPKGVAEAGENFAAAAARELHEETGLVAAPEELAALGVHAYLHGKDLALFAWEPPQLPDPRSLVCSSHFALPNGTMLPELDRFDLFPWDEALSRVGKNLARILGTIRHSAGSTELRRRHGNNGDKLAPIAFPSPPAVPTQRHREGVSQARLHQAEETGGDVPEASNPDRRQR